MMMEKGKKRQRRSAERRFENFHGPSGVTSRTSPPEMYEVSIVFRYLNKTAKTLLTDGRVM